MTDQKNKNTTDELEKKVKELTEELAYYKTLIDQLPIGVYRTSRAGLFMQVNPALAKMLGYSVEELADKSAKDMFADPDMRAGQLERWRDESGINSDELQFHTKAGHSIWVRDTGKAILDENGEIDYFDGVIENVTERKEAQRALNESEERFRQTQKMEALGRLASGVAHDINNVLGAVMGSASAVRFERRSDADIVEDLNNILKACKKGRELTRNLLGFSRKGTPTMSVVSPNKVIEELLGLLSRTFPKKIRVRKYLADNVHTISGDWTQIEQALMNVCLNALDAMDGDGVLEILTRNVTIDPGDTDLIETLLPGDHVEIAISDSGPGIDEKILEQVFEPFFTTKPKGEGTGLGLSTVYGIVKNHGGTVRLRSTKGQGTLATFLFPAAEDSDKARMSSTPPPPKPDMGKKKTVLLVDDETTILRANSRMLGMLGFEVISVAHATDAARLYAAYQSEVSLVILDMIMPELDGSEVFHAIRKINPGARIVLCSGYTRSEQVEELLASGALGFLQKPFGMKTLVKMLEQVVG